ncbi:MAG: hypothetical protein ACRC2V_12755 [Xenococcaceae cyanobacterium]
MSNISPVRTEEFKKHNYQSYGGHDNSVPLGKKDFSIRVPVDVEKVLLEMDAKERVAFMRSLIVKAVRERCQDVLSQ